MKYHNQNKCIKCDEPNDVTVIDTINGYISECDTRCVECGHCDHWAYGAYASTSEPPAPHPVYYARFDNMPPSDLVRLPFWKWARSSYWRILVDLFSQDVMKMTTFEWCMFPVVLVLWPFTVAFTWSSYREVRDDMARDDGVVYDGVELYFVDLSEFDAIPREYRD